MRKLSLCAIVALCVWLILIMSGCAMLQNLIGQPQLQTYSFTYNGGEYSALLPKEVPLPPEDAAVDPMCYFNGICVLHIAYMAGNQPEIEYPVASFWFTKELGVVALIWHTLKADGSRKHIGWLYVKGLPVPTHKKAFEAFMNELPGKQ